MEARTILCWLACAAAWLPTHSAAQTYQANSENFVVFAPDRQLAKRAAELAEQYRRELSIDWLGYEIARWQERCPVHIQIGPHAGGETSFAFVSDRSGKSQPISWKMKIYGPPDRLLDAVLPHEVTHTIFATHFGQPLPRWADEGACTTVEHESEREKNHRMLISFLSASPSRGIPFNRMFTMKQYPHDILPLYAQGYSVAKYLINQKGRQHFVKFLEYGMSQEQSNYDTSTWDQATDKFYDYKNLSDLQVSWEGWVRSGSPLTPATQVIASATNANSNSLVDPAATYTVANSADAKGAAEGIAGTGSNPNPVADNINREIAAGGNSGNWYARQSRGKQAVTNPEQTARATPAGTPGGFRPGSLKRDELSDDTTLTGILRHTAPVPQSTMWR